MELYDESSRKMSRSLTLSYSSSFGMSSRLLHRSVRPHIYAVYGLVRIADEIVDTYKGEDARVLLSNLERETLEATKRGYSTNPIIHSFALSARQYGIGQSLTKPFFASMRLDLEPQKYNDSLYKKYVEGSAEVVGLMCLKIFVGGDEKAYKSLEPGARALGAAYQKVNFLRDMRSDFEQLGRVYFPGVSLDGFDEEQKMQIVQDIKKDFAAALPAIKRLPRRVRTATMLSFTYYTALLKKLGNTPVEKLLSKRVRIGSIKKLWLLMTVGIGSIVKV